MTVTQRIDRRKRPRFALRCPVRLAMNDRASALETQTENVSSAGFYCVAEEPLSLGEMVECVLQLPDWRRGLRDKEPLLRCRARVVRVTPSGCGYGLAFSIIAFEFSLED